MNADKFIKVAEISISRLVEILTEAHRFDAIKYDLACLGGAEGQDSCSVAEDLKFKRSPVQKCSSILPHME